MADKSYQQLRKELDAILDRLQTGDMDIDEAFKQYEAGSKLVKELETKLQEAENKIIKLKD